MRITLTWINICSIIFAIITDAVTTTADEDSNDNGKLKELDEIIVSQNKKIIIKSDGDLNSDNEDDRISKDFYTSNDGIIADLSDKKTLQIDGNPSENISATAATAQQSNSHHQVQLNNDDESPARSSNRRKFSKKKKKKRKRTKQRGDKKKSFQQRHRNSSDDLKAEENNFPTAENNFADKNRFPIKHNSAEQPSTKAPIVMEMVEAIIDNNFEANVPALNRVTSVDDDESNLQATTRLRDPASSSSSSASQLSPESQSGNLQTKVQTLESVQSPPIEVQSKAKINRQLKRRRKLLIGDLSCMKADFVPAPRIANANIKYIRNEMFGVERSFLEAEYHCRRGYKLIKKFKRKSVVKNKNLVCKKRRWIGQRAMCREIELKSKTADQQQCDMHEARKCEQLCVRRENSTEATCACHKGFRLIGTRCFDINECDEMADVCGGNGKCINSLGSFKCSCRKGFRMNSHNRCVDVNECFLRGGHGPCQDECRNTIGSYDCSCVHLLGTKLAKDGHSCEEFDLCSIINGGCSHTCLHTIGQTFCSCPDGWMLDADWKTCIDIDECQLQDTMKPEQRCNFDCINLPGSYRCVDSSEMGADQPADFDDYTVKQENNGLKDSYDAEGNYDIIEGGSSVSECSNGYYFNETMGDCQDINECEIDNGNCSNGTCVNTNGSFLCSCHKGFVSSEDDRYKCIPQKTTSASSEAPLSSINVACPPLFPPLHGYLECSRPVENSTTTTTARLKITNRPGSQCILRCPTSYRASGTFVKTCGEDGNWHGDDDGICIKYPTPKLICPPTVIAELPPFSDIAEVRIPRAKTDLNMKRDVTIKPSWIKARNERVALEKGELNVTYTAKHPISKLTTSCSTTIYVVDGEPPSVDFCPPTQKYKIEKHHDNIKAFWIEPKFSDNVKVTDVTKTNDPGSVFGLGSHQIIYEARDAAGYKNRCTFKVIVNAPKREGLKLPIENKNKFYI